MPPSPLFGACVRDRKGAKEDTATKRMRGREKKGIKAVGVCSVCFFLPRRALCVPWPLKEEVTWHLRQSSFETVPFLSALCFPILRSHRTPQRTPAIQSMVDCFDKKFTLLVSAWPVIILFYF